jgi:hypothetical protein
VIVPTNLIPYNVEGLVQDGQSIQRLAMLYSKEVYEGLPEISKYFETNKYIPLRNILCIISSFYDVIATMMEYGLYPTWSWKDPMNLSKLLVDPRSCTVHFLPVDWIYAVRPHPEEQHKDAREEILSMSHAFLVQTLCMDRNDMKAKPLPYMKSVHKLVEDTRNVNEDTKLDSRWCRHASARFRDMSQLVPEGHIFIASKVPPKIPGMPHEPDRTFYLQGHQDQEKKIAEMRSKYEAHRR